MDAPTIRRVLRDFFKFNPKDFLVQGSPTGYLISRLSNSGGSSPTITYGFQWFPATNQDDPATRGRLIQVYEGIINGNIVPDNMASVFELPNDSDSYLQCAASVSALGVVNAATLTIESNPAPPDPEGSLGVAGATSARDLWKFTVANNQITLAVALRIGGLDVLPQVVDVSCGQTTLQMRWGASGLQYFPSSSR